MEITRDLSRQRHLNEALKEKDLPAVLAALQAGADPNWRPQWTDFLETPMAAAAEANFLAGLDVLLQAGADVDARNRKHDSPLMSAVLAKNVEAGRWLLDHGADPYHKGSLGRDVVVIALQGQQFDFLETLFHRHPKCREKLLPAAATSVIGRFETMEAQWLLQQGISPNLLDENGYSWLRITQRRFSRDAIPLTDLLLQAGAEVDLKDDSGDAPLHTAYESKSKPLFLRLLAAGADPDLPDRSGRSVRHFIEHPELESDFKEILKAWDASRAAHQAIEETSAHVEARPL